MRLRERRESLAPKRPTDAESFEPRERRNFPPIGKYPNCQRFHLCFYGWDVSLDNQAMFVDWVKRENWNFMGANWVAWIIEGKTFPEYITTHVWSGEGFYDPMRPSVHGYYEGRTTPLFGYQMNDADWSTFHCYVEEAPEELRGANEGVMKAWREARLNMFRSNMKRWGIEGRMLGMGEP